MNRILAFFSIAVALLGATAIPAAGQGTTRVSVDSAGAEGNGESHEPAISPDGRFVAFYSSASNLVPGDTNGVDDVFVHVRRTGETSRVSVDSANAQGNGGSYISPISSISTDGRFMTFWSYSSNLVPGDGNGVVDIFVRDRETGATSRVSVDSAGAEGNGDCGRSSISSNGRFVAFHSAASNLAPGDTNNLTDVFVHDRETGATSRVSVDSSGAGGNTFGYFSAISSNGRFVVFESSSSNLVPGDTNGTNDIFVHDLRTGLTSRVSVDSAGVEGNGFSSYSAISSNGRFVAFNSSASNLVPGDTNDDSDVFVHDRRTGATSRVSIDSAGAEAIGSSTGPSISPNGRFISFHSGASNLVPNDANGSDDVFVHDRWTGETSRVSVDSAGAEGNGNSRGASMSSLGHFIAFDSDASNLAPGDTNGKTDIFVRDRSACDEGRVNAGAGEIVDVLFVNGSAGGPARRIALAPNTPFVVNLDSSPAAPGPGVYAMYAWPGASVPGEERVLPFGIGTTCRATPLSGGGRMPRAIWNSTGQRALGAPTMPSPLTPATLLEFPAGLGSAGSFYLQGIIADPGSAGSKPASVTNGITIDVR